MIKKITIIIILLFHAGVSAVPVSGNVTTPSLNKSFKSDMPAAIGFRNETFLTGKFIYKFGEDYPEILDGDKRELHYYEISGLLGLSFDPVFFECYYEPLTKKIYKYDGNKTQYDISVVQFHTALLISDSLSIGIGCYKKDNDLVSAKSVVNATYLEEDTKLGEDFHIKLLKVFI